MSGNCDFEPYAVLAQFLGGNDCVPITPLGSALSALEKPALLDVLKRVIAASPGVRETVESLASSLLLPPRAASELVVDRLAETLWSWWQNGGVGTKTMPSLDVLRVPASEPLSQQSTMASGGSRDGSQEVLSEVDSGASSCAASMGQGSACVLENGLLHLALTLSAAAGTSGGWRSDFGSGNSAGGSGNSAGWSGYSAGGRWLPPALAPPFLPPEFRLQAEEGGLPSSSPWAAGGGEVAAGLPVHFPPTAAGRAGAFFDDVADLRLPHIVTPPNTPDMVQHAPAEAAVAASPSDEGSATPRPRRPARAAAAELAAAPTPQSAERKAPADGADQDATAAAANRFPTKLNRLTVGGRKELEAAAAAAAAPTGGRAALAQVCAGVARRDRRLWSEAQFALSAALALPPTADPGRRVQIVAAALLDGQLPSAADLGLSPRGSSAPEADAAGGAGPSLSLTQLTARVDFALLELTLRAAPAGVAAEVAAAAKTFREQVLDSLAAKEPADTPQ